MSHISKVLYAENFLQNVNVFGLLYTTNNNVYMCKNVNIKITRKMVMT